VRKRFYPIDSFPLSGFSCLIMCVYHKWSLKVHHA
jgi:hypothetical protein